MTEQWAELWREQSTQLVLSASLVIISILLNKLDYVPILHFLFPLVNAIFIQIKFLSFLIFSVFSVRPPLVKLTYDPAPKKEL